MSDLILSEMVQMGIFVNPSQPQHTRSGRISKPPLRYEQEKFLKGSGCCPRPGMEPTDMEFDGST